MLLLRDDGVGDVAVRDRLETLLSEGVESARRRERTAFDEMAAPFERRLVLFGAGRLGRRTLAGLRRNGVEPMAFSDNNPAVWGKTIDGLPVLPPPDAARKLGGTAAFVLTIWNGNLSEPCRDRLAQLRGLGCRKVIPAPFLFWKQPADFLPFYTLDLPHRVLAHADEVWAAFRLWADDRSRREYLAQMAFRLLLDFDGLGTPARLEQYFPPDLYRLRPDETLVDCGAYDGDTITSFVGRQGSQFTRIVAYEPDPYNWAKLERTVGELPPPIRGKIACFQRAVGARQGTVAFDATGTDSSSSGSGPLLVPSISLDESLREESPTIVKFDIEGAEMDALAGARRTMESGTAILAVSAYHRQSDLWEIPLLVSAAGDYRFFLRSHGFDGCDLVCYAVPLHRVVNQ